MNYGELCEPFTMDDPPSDKISGTQPYRVGTFTTEGTHTEPTIGQIWPR